MIEMLEIEFLFRMTSNIKAVTELGGSACLDIAVNLKTYHIDAEDNAEAAPKELFDLIDRHERRSQLNIKSPLEINL